MNTLINLPGNSTTNDLILAIKKIEAMIILLNERVELLEKNKKRKA